MNLLAPGSGINSSLPNSAYATWNGTSMATPHVAGAWAILRQKAPNATVSEVLAALSNNGVAVTDSRNSLVKPRINLPASLAVLTTAQYALTVSKTGTGTGSVSSSPAGIDCGSTCSANFASGTVITLSPVVSGNNLFTGWSGACTGTGTCSVTMSAAKSMSANFDVRGAITPVNLSNLAGAVGSTAYFSFNVPAGASNLVVKTLGGTGNVDLLVRASALPTNSIFQCESHAAGNNETCTFATPLATTYYILLDGILEFSGVTLTASYTSATLNNPGSLGFTAISMSVRENAGNAVITVTRTGGSDDVASVSYSTSAGSAVAGVDYGSVAGSLTWGSGDASDRSFSVPIINNTIRNQGSRVFTVNLTNATGASLLSTSNMAVRINDDEIISMPWLNLLLLD
ncbi:MAG: pre-peptidase C-terminal domain-containing protein [Comamonadaceae bacterium]|nr:pre-peptidase C-terminal domain-containing protein [Comamonadaceae bacterium]